MHFGQFLAHEMSHTPPVANAHPREYFPIIVPEQDPSFEGLLLLLPSTYNSTIASGARRRTGNCHTDGSAIYGNDAICGRLGGLMRFAEVDPDKSVTSCELPLNKEGCRMIILSKARRRALSCWRCAHEYSTRSRCHARALDARAQLWASWCATVPDAASDLADGDQAKFAGVLDSEVFEEVRRLVVADSCNRGRNMFRRL